MKNIGTYIYIKQKIGTALSLVEHDDNGVKLLTLARARILALWVAMISDSVAASADMVTRVATATLPSDVASLLLNLATKLEEQVNHTHRISLCLKLYFIKK
jgi:hypothetical protein